MLITNSTTMMNCSTITTKSITTLIMLKNLLLPKTISIIRKRTIMGKKEEPMVKRKIKRQQEISRTR
jgi:hypothetical protein